MRARLAVAAAIAVAYPLGGAAAGFGAGIGSGAGPGLSTAVATIGAGPAPGADSSSGPGYAQGTVPIRGDRGMEAGGARGWLNQVYRYGYPEPVPEDLGGLSSSGRKGE